MKKEKIKLEIRRHLGALEKLERESRKVEDLESYFAFKEGWGNWDYFGTYKIAPPISEKELQSLVTKYCQKDKSESMDALWEFEEFLKKKGYEIRTTSTPTIIFTYKKLKS